MAVGQPTPSKEFLKDIKELIFFVFKSILFHPNMVDGKQEYLKISVLQ